jgi:hypothetical protein
VVSLVNKTRGSVLTGQGVEGTVHLLNKTRRSVLTGERGYGTDTCLVRPGGLYRCHLVEC